MRRFVLLLLVASLAGCPTPVPEGPVESNFLRLQGFVSVDADAGSLEGFLRWIYVADDPGEFDEPRTDCEVWEYVDLAAVEPDDSCSGCTDQFDGTATIEAGDTTCDDADWPERAFTIAFAAIGSMDEPDRTELAAEGYTHAVSTRWSPEIGDSQGFQDLFAAEPDQWAPDAGEAGEVDSVDGQYHLLCRYFWELD